MLKAVLVINLFLFSAGLWAGEVADSSGSGTDSSEQYSSVAQKCGVQIQNQFNHRVGVPHCGEAVTNMIQCVAKSVDINCDASCGPGRGFINCKDKMTKCGYQSVDVTSALCRKPGAVLAYYDSGTANGHLWGHVEMACGDNLFCSVYKAPVQGNWKNAQTGKSQTPDACWFPAKNGKVPDAGKIPAGEMSPGPGPGFSGGGGGGGNGGGSYAPSYNANGSPSFGGGSPASGGGASNAMQSLAPLMAGAAAGYLAYNATHPQPPLQRYMFLYRPGLPPVMVPANSGVYPYGLGTPISPVPQAPLYLSNGQYIFTQPQFRTYPVGGL